MKLPRVQAVVISITLLVAAIGCSAIAPVEVAPTPNIDATVEARVKQEVAAQLSATPVVVVKEVTPVSAVRATSATPLPATLPTNTPTEVPSTPTEVPPTATRVPPTATPVPTPVAHLWVGELLDQVEANEILAGVNYTGKLISVTGHIKHLGGAVWPRSGYEIEIEDVGGYDIKNSGQVYCYPQSSQEPLLTKLLKGGRITVEGIVEELEGSWLATVRLKSCLIDDITFNPEPIDPSCVSLQGSYEDGYGYLIVEFTAQNNCGVAVWFAVAGSATFITNQPWSFTVSEYDGDYFVLGPDDILVDEEMVEKPDWADGRPGEISAVDLDISLASITGLP